MWLCTQSARAQTTQATQGAQVPPSAAGVQRYALANGLDVVLEERRGSPRVAVEVDYHVGSRDQPFGHAGLAHMTEHMMFAWARHDSRGGGAYLDAMGAVQWLGETQPDVTRYGAVVGVQYLERLLAFEADRMGFLLANIDDAQLDAQRAIVLRERSERGAYWAVPELGARVWQALFRSGHPYHAIRDEPTDIASFTTNSVRWFHQRWYTPSNATLVIVGDFDSGVVRAMVQRYFGGLARVPRPERSTDRGIPPIPTIGDARMIETVRVANDRLWVMFPTPRAFSDGDAELDLAADALARDEFSALTATLSRDRLADAVSAHQMSMELASVFVITAMVNRRSSGESALQQTEYIVRETARSVSEQTISIARDARITALRAQNSTLAGRAAALGMYARLGRDSPDLLEWDVARYSRATATSVRAAMVRWLSPTSRLVAIARGAVNSNEAWIRAQMRPENPY